MDDSIVAAKENSTESFEDLDWDGLLEVCREKEEQLNLAGACGLKLHEQLVETQAHIDEMRLHHDQEIERLIQESYELKNKLEVKEKALSTQENDFEEFQKQMYQKREEEIEEIQENMKKEIRGLKKEKNMIFSDFEQAQIRENQYLEQIETLKKRIQDLQNESIQRVKVSTNDDCQEELLQLRERNLNLEETLIETNERISQVSSKNQSLMLELSTQSKEVSELRIELEQVEIRCTTYFNHLQQAREEKQEVKAELDLLKAESRNSSHKSSGNSLFGEVEDRRIEMEKKLLSMQIKHDSLVKAYNFSKNQLHSMKNQVYALLQMKNARADEDHISRLERALSQAKSENAILTKKLNSSDCKQDMTKEDIEKASNLPDFKKSKDLVEFLYSQIEDYKVKLDNLQKEFDQIYMVKIAESDKLHTAEQKLYETSARADSSSQANMRLKLKLEETKNRLEAEIQKRKFIEKKFNYDSTNDIVPEGEIKETKKIEKNTIPFSIRKADEASNDPSQTTSRHTKSSKLNHKNKLPLTTESFTSGMQWHKLPKEILDQLGIVQQENSPPKTQEQPHANSSSAPQHEPRIHSTSSESEGTDKPRRVSFKDTPEKMVFKERTYQDLLNSAVLEKEEHMKNSSLRCKKKLVSNLKHERRLNHLSPLKDSSNQNDKTNKHSNNGSLQKKKTAVTEEEEANCQVQ